MENEDVIYHYTPLGPEYNEEHPHYTNFFKKYINSWFKFNKKTLIYIVLASISVILLWNILIYKKETIPLQKGFIEDLTHFVDVPISELVSIKKSPFLKAFGGFKREYNKTYKTFSEEEKRFKIFVENYLKILRHNKQGDISYTLKMNHFGDLSPEEFKKTHLTYRSRRHQIISEEINEKNLDGSSIEYKQKKNINELNNKIQSELNTESNPTSDRMKDPFLESYIYGTPTDLPEYVNWSERGCVSEIKNQGNCGSCWAFSATGSVEGAYCIKYSKLVSLSEQQLVDCTIKEGNIGCSGGNVDQAFLYMIKKQSLCTENDYPYKAITLKCHDNKCRRYPIHYSKDPLEKNPSELPQVRVIGYVDVPARQEQALMAAVAFRGPVSVGVESDDWQFYHSGIYSAPCGNNLDHAVLVVGYGTQNNTGYWIIKNSWGSRWGNHGFMKLVRNHRSSGECGILLDATFPIVQ